LRLCQHGREPLFVDPLRETLICQQDLTFLERTPGGVDTLVPVGEAKRYDFGAEIFCREPTCLESPGRGEDGAFCFAHQSLSLVDMPTLIPHIDLDTASRVPKRASSESAETVITPDASNAFVVLNDGQAPMGSPRVGGGVGLVYARRGKAMLVTATPSGQVTIAVTIGNRDPGADHRFDDIVEIDFIARTPDLYLAGPFEFVHARLPDLPAGTGAYRVRYHGRGLDSAGPGEAPANDAYLLQMFPTRPAPSVVVAEGSEFARFRRR
jgi:hypothetical protein